MAVVTPTFDTLSAEVAGALWNLSSDATDKVPNWIARAEQRIFRELGADGFATQTAISLMANTRAYTIPTGLKAWRYFWITLSSGQDIELEARSEAYLREFWPARSTTGQPRYFAIYGPTTYVVAPTPDAAYAGMIGYYAGLTPLHSGNQTSWLTENAYGLILAAACAEGANVLAGVNTMDTELSRLQSTWEAAYQRELALLRSEQRRREQSNDRRMVETTLNKGHA